MSTTADTADLPPAARPDAGEPAPAEAPVRSTAFTVGLAVIMVVALVVRVAFVLIRQSKVHLTTGDAYWYHWQARLVADGHGFLNPFDYYKNHRSTPGADHPPGMIVILAVADKLGIASAQAQRVLMCVLGTGTVGVVGLAGRRIATVRVGLVAAGLAAVYPNIWINDGMLMSETPFLLGVAVALLFTYRVVASPTVVNVVALSAGLTLAALTRPESIVLFPLYLVPVVLARQELSWRDRALRVVAAAVVPIVLFTPWIAYNLSRFDKPVWISTGAGQTLAVGNCDLTYHGQFLGFYDVACLFPPQITPPSATDPSVRDPQYQKLAVHYIRTHERDVPKVVAARVGRMWQVYRVGQGRKLDGWIEGRSGGPPGSGLQVVVWAQIGFVLLVPFAIGGAIVLRRRRVKVYPLLVQAGLATFVAATTFGVTRYRAGAEIALVVLAAVAVDALVSRLRPGPPAAAGAAESAI